MNYQSGFQRNGISIHALREEGDPNVHAVADEVGISIHALREEGDLVAVYVYDDNRIFLSTPSARRATVDRSGRVVTRVFLSTPSARRATIAFVVFGDSPCNFYPRPPRGGRQTNKLAADLAQQISIHALREEGDRWICSHR